MHPFKSLLLALAVCLMPALALAATAPSTDTSALTDAQKKAVEAVVRDLLLKKEPEIIIKAAQIMQEKMEKDSVVKSKESIATNRKKLLNNPDSPVGGNPKGDVTVVEFFDYLCGYCKMAQGHLEKLTAADKNVRVVYKEFGILGPVSIEAAKAAQASNEQGKYVAFHNALMTSKERLTSDKIYEIAEKVGLDVEKLKKDMESDKVKKAIADVHALADEMGARGTPTFVIGEKLYPGALPLAQLKEAVAKARKDKK